MKRDFNRDTIVAISTPVGDGGIGIVRLSGNNALKIADKVFISADKRKASRFKTHTIHYGHIVDSKKETIDEVLLTVMKAPRTYTKEDVVEINCHGGIVPLRKVTEAVVKNGARAAEPGEFTKRAFLNGRLDLVQAEAVLDVIRARTDAGLKASMGQLEGELSRKIDSARREILEVCAEVEADIDFPEEDTRAEAGRSRIRKIKKTRSALENLANTYYHGSIVRNGLTAVIAGRTNAGKSSLMNLLLKRDRVIVTHIPGTTRDAIEEFVNIKGIPIRLVDTAGMKKGRCPIEIEGMSKSRLFMSRADIVLCVLDGSERLKRDDRELLKSLNGKCSIVAVNKCDRKLAVDTKDIRRASKNNDIVKISCLTRKGIDRLEEKIYNKVWSGKARSSNQSMLNNVRHKDAIDRAVGSLLRAEDTARKGFAPEILSIDIRESIGALGEITGETYTEDILNIIFSSFCIGK